MASAELPSWHGTTILTVRKGGTVVIGGDGQVSIGQTIIKSNARKVRKLGKGDVIGGFAGATADAFTLFERLESKLEQYPGQLTRAAVERHMQKLRAVSGREDKRTAAYELAGIFKRRIAMLKAFGDHAVPLACRDPVDLLAQLDTLGHTVHRDHTFCSVIKGGSDRGSGSEDIDDHHNSLIYIIQMQQGRGQGRI